MKRVDRYLLAGFMMPLMLGISLFLFALIMDRLFELLDLVFNRGVSIFTVAWLLACLLPSIVAVTLPMAVLLGSLVLFGQLAADKELLAFKGAGLGLGRLAAPLALAGATFSLVLLLFNGTVLPWANAQYKQVFFDIVRTRAAVALRERVFVSEFKPYLLYFEKKVGSEGGLEGLSVVEYGEWPPRFITAQRGKLEMDQATLKVKLVLEDGTVDQPADAAGKQYSRIDFGTYELELDIASALRGGRLFVKGISEMSYLDLLKAARRERVAREKRPYEVEFHQRIALAFASLFVVFVGVPLGALAKRGGGVGFVISFVIIGAYYFILTMAQGVAEGGTLPPWIALWIPNIFMAVAGWVAFWAASNEAQWIRWGR